jgi:hypothetical protein
MPAELRVNAQQPPSAPKGSKMQGKGMSGAMMGQSMMSQHHEVSKLVDQVIVDLAALQNQEDLGTIKTKLAADQALLRQLHLTCSNNAAWIGCR